MAEEEKGNSVSENTCASNSAEPRGNNGDKESISNKTDRQSRQAHRGDGDSSRYRNRDYKAHRGPSGYHDSRYGKKPYKRNWSNPKNDGKRQKLQVGNRLKEPDIGVTEYVSKYDGFTGIVKERYSDFHVSEINLDEQIAKLTNQDIPSEPKSETLDDLRKTVSETVWEQLQTLKEADISTPPIKIDVTAMDKNERRAIHTIAKKMTNVLSQTIDEDNKKIVIIAKENKRNTNAHGFRRDDRIDWKQHGGDYCHFILHKVNLDTMDALNQLAMNLRIKSNNFNYAGTKDRRAWTSQWVSIKKVAPYSILRAGKQVQGAYVGNFKYAKEPLKLGMLKGNRFRIALRNVSVDDEHIEKVMTSLRDNGFINYYGLQRFGTVAAIPTHEIGKALLQGKWNEAIELILKPRDGEQDTDLAEARVIYMKTKDAYAAYQRVRRHDKIEAALLKGIYLSDNKNPQGALDSIPRNTRLMYIHSYQSLVWNHMVSRRIKEFGTHPIVGDLVYKSSESIEQVEPDNLDETKLSQKDDSPTSIMKLEQVSEVVEKLESDTHPTAEEEEETIASKESEKKQEQIPDTVNEVTTATECNLKIDEDSEDDKEKSEELNNLPPVKILTEEDLPNYTLADIIMPQPGWKVTYPPYAKSWFDEFLAKDNLTTDLRQKNKKYSLGGAYRKMLQIPSDLSWKIMHYQDKYDDLIMSDINELRNMTPPKDKPEGPNKALIVEMSLASSSYATMALREILKNDTSAQAQAAQSAACNAQDEDDVEEIPRDENTNKPVPSSTAHFSKAELAHIENALHHINDIPL